MTRNVTSQELFRAPSSTIPGLGYWVGWNLNFPRRCRRGGDPPRHSSQFSGCRVLNARYEILQTDSHPEFSGLHDIRDTRVGDLLRLGNSRGELKERNEQAAAKCAGNCFLPRHAYPLVALRAGLKHTGFV